MQRQPDEPTTLALTTTDPQEDTRVGELYKKAVKLRDYVAGASIQSPEDVQAAADNLSFIKGVLDAIVAKRMEYTRPLRNRATEIDAYFKAFTEPLGAANEILRRKVVAFQEAQQRIQDEQERINREKEAIAVAEMELNQELSQPIDRVEVTPAPTTTHTDFTTMSKTTTWKWRLKDIKLVPLDNLMVDSAKVTRLVKAGSRDIPGIEIYSVGGVSVAPKREAVPQPPVALQQGPEALAAPQEADAPDLPF